MKRDKEARTPRQLREHGKLYQDQLYGAKTLSPLAVAIIDTPEFQRLGGLRQLGFSDVVYRGARHSRFEHSVGTYLMCKQIMRRIVQNHERLNLEHPGKYISNNYRLFPSNSEVAPAMQSLQARWRGLMEIVSAAALLHDLGHVPFGHTLEDEFTGIFLRHDRLGGSRLYEMLFNPESALARVFTEAERWLPGIPNEQIRDLIYLMLSWKERVAPPQDFEAIIKSEQEKSKGGELERINKLAQCYADFTGPKPLFQPFMSDIIGNTICSDLLDYLPRDRANLGMEVRRHDRLQRYFTIRRGSLHHNEGYRMSIMVTRTGHGGQRRDVASAVLGIMRERFEMAEAVYYHHKKAAASAMLAKLAELAEAVDAELTKNGAGEAKRKPRDDDAIYPAPWTEKGADQELPPHMTHLSDAELIDYLGLKVPLTFADKKRESHLIALQRRLYLSLRYRRKEMYRTLLVIDTDLVEKSSHSISYFVTRWRGPKESPSNAERLNLENKLAAAGQAAEGDVILYCPDANMQSKLIDARLEIQVNRILPLRVQSAFVYGRDVETLSDYYESLWRAYIFVSPALFASKQHCEALVRAFCEEYAIDWNEAKKKIRGHDFDEPSVAEQVELLPKDSFKAFDAGKLFSAVEPFIVLPGSERKELREYLGTFAHRANALSPERQERVRELLGEVLLTQAASKARFNRPGLKAIEAEFERFLIDLKDGGETTK